ncbi:helix-turn-helix transcriptional regulator [Flavobacterium sp.]|uniref:helix-turn-helix transcriptional regulator n=1 Tax=Flavobacterium sp. TaxID=239 RepID=UPI00260DB8DD|nr:helix-turn-helix transcriptional regulator [Flavobacterium sp.]
MAKFLRDEKLPQQYPMMKKEASIRTLLSLTQENAAMLLGVSRSQWSMYEIGQRDLPLAAKQLLAEMLTHIQKPSATAKPATDKQQRAKQHQQLERLLRENEYQQLVLARKTATIQKKQDAQARLSILADFLNKREAKGEATGAMHHQSILRKAQQTLADDHANILMQYELKKEVLEFEQKVIEYKMKQQDL